MKVQDFIDQVAHKSTMDIGGSDSEVWLSNFDNSYMTHVGMEDHLKPLADREITEQLTHGVGFSPKDGKWYGWSHRAIYGFEVGSTCSKGDCHYRAGSEDDEIEAALRFWSDTEHHHRTWVESAGEGVIEVKWEYSNKVPNEKLRGTIGGSTWEYNPSELGKGEWVAQTMKDAKQMAADFNEGIS